MRSLVLVLVLLIPSIGVTGTNVRLPVYVAGYLDRQAIPVESRKFRPLVATASVGVWLMEGISTELEFGVGIVEDQVSALEFEAGSQLGLNLRFESPPGNGLSAYVLVGYSSARYETIFSFESAPDERNFTGVRGAFGLVFPLAPRWTMDASFNRHEYDGDFGVNAFRVGVRYAVNNVRPVKRPGWLR